MRLSFLLLPFIASLVYAAPAAESPLTSEIDRRAPPPNRIVHHYEASFEGFATPSLLPVGISYADVPNYVYGGLKYSTKWKIANIGKDIITNLNPPSSPNVLALPNAKPKQFGADWTVGTFKDTFGIYSFYFACATDVVGNPEALACFIELSCQTRSQLTQGVEDRKFYPYTGGSKFAYALVNRIMPTKDAVCAVRLQNATTPLTGEPYTGSALVLVDNFNYYFNTTSPT